jgi:DNA-binding transcriptional MerR regulator
VDEMDIHEVIERTGVPRRTIYYYIQMGILPPPKGKGKNYEYTEEHVRRLLIIKKLQEMRYSLKEIKELFDSFTQDTVERMVREEAPPQVLYKVDRMVSLPKVAFLRRKQPVSIQWPKGERWLRIKLKEGLELHIRLPLKEETRKFLEENFPQILKNIERR